MSARRGRPSLDDQRAEVEAARRALRTAATEVQTIGDELDALKRAARPRGAAAIERAERALAQAQARRDDATVRLAAAVRGVSPLVEAQLPVTPAEEVGRLDAGVPIALLPVRIETRFAGNQLLLRIYPDDIFTESHEPELTDVEIADGEQFWTAAWPDEANERLAWKVLVDAVGAPRGAYIADQLKPANLAIRPADAPVFPNVPRRESSWTRAAHARLLPDRWIITLYGPDGTRTVTSSAVHEPLALTISPDPNEPRSDLSDDGLQIDDASRWTVDFAEAVNVGMALRIPVSATERAKGFDRIIVVGVKSSLAPDDASTALQALLSGHGFDRGVSFLAQGTPTNNTSAAPSAFPPPDREGKTSFAALRRDVAPLANRDGGRFTLALGLPEAAAKHWSGADCRSDDCEAAMARALWPATLRYFLEQMMAPVFSQGGVQLAQRFFVEHVRGRGPLPAFRIGNTPYGVLPVSSLARWQTAAKGANALERELPTALRRLLPLWQAQVPNVPRVGRTPNDPDADLLGILGMDASTREARVRNVLGQDVQWNLFGLMDWTDAWLDWWDNGQVMTAELADRLGHPAWRPRIGLANFADTAWPFANKLVAEDPVSEDKQSLSPNYIEWIGTASVPDLDTQRFPNDWPRRPRSLLYKLLRHGALLEYHDAAFALLERADAITEAARVEHELVGLPGQSVTVNRMQRLSRKIGPITGQQTLHEYLADRDNAAAVKALTLPQDEVTGFRDALALLAPLPTAELERLFTETLDVVSHRIDAWITALVTQRLDRMREVNPSGINLGAYGWVENLTPRPAAPGNPVAIGGGRTAERQSGNGGFVQTPSLMHAGAAAVLRNAYLSRSGTVSEQFAVDLSSARVRAARFVLDAVREGQQLGAVLGYQVERGLHDAQQDKAIDPLRGEFPLVAGKSNDPDDDGEPKEQIAARNVVDGLALGSATVDDALAGKLGFDPAGPAWQAVLTEVARLRETIDAVADLLLAESVFQLVKGSPSTAAATLDAMAQGAVRPPDPEIATVPRRGTPLTHRVAIVLGDGAAALPAGWVNAPTPRAELEPWVDAWLGSLFGDATAVRCSVSLGPAAAPTAETTVSLDELTLRPIDFLALARSWAQEGGTKEAGASELDRRVRDAAYVKAAVAQETETRITYDRPATGFDAVTDRTFADLLELARTIERVLERSRPLAPADLMAEDRESDASAANLLPDDALTSAQTACDRLKASLDAVDLALQAALAVADDAPFDLTALRAALRKLSLSGVPGAYPVSALGSSPEIRPALVAQAKGMLAGGREALARAQEKVDDGNAAPDPAGRVELAVEAVGLAMGRSTPFLPRFRLRPAGAPTPSDAEAELGNALSYAADAAFIANDAVSRAREVRRFEMVAARVRPALDAWRRLEFITGLLGGGRSQRAVAQLPYEAGARWAALPFADQAHRPRAGRVSILMQRIASPTPDQSWGGYLLDTWVEFIPQPVEQTGIAFHYDDPGAEAPQTILLAVPPGKGTKWDLDSLLAILNETLDLAKVRAVDGELLGALGQVLPAIYLADSTSDVTVQTQFVAAQELQMEPIIVSIAPGGGG